MGLKKLAAKLQDYDKRLANGNAFKIKPAHVEKILKKLRKKEAELDDDLSHKHSADKRQRLERKRGVAREQIDRAQWLLDQIDRSS